MTSATTTPNTTNQSYREGDCGKMFPWDQVSEPGAYICHWSGHLLRIPEDGVTAGRSPLVNLIGSEPLYVTKISANPFITLTKARILASNFDLNVNF